MDIKQNWKTISLSLKILFFLFILWAIGAMFALPMRYDQGLPFFTFTLYGIYAAIIVFILDILGPVLFIISIWKKYAWGPLLAYSFIGIFILNSIVAIFTVGNELGIMPILIPALVYGIFGAIIYKNKKYFK